MLRFDREPAYVDAVLAAYVDRRGGTPAEALALARAADLWALVDLAARAQDNLVTKLAHELLRAIAGDARPARRPARLTARLGWTAAQRRA